MATLRRNLEQIVHCTQEALSVVEHDELRADAVADLEQARDLIDHVLGWMDPARPAPTPGAGKGRP